MTPKKKANILIEKFYQAAPEVMGTGRAQEYGVEMAKIVVNEVIDNVPMYIGNLNPKWKFWDDVRTVLNSL